MTQQVSDRDTNSNSNISDSIPESNGSAGSDLSLGRLSGAKGLFFGITIGVLMTLAGSSLAFTKPIEPKH